MNKKILIGCALVAALLSACGGGGGTSSITGTLAVGAPIDSGVITVFDATGAQVATATTDTDGKYTLNVPSSAQAPFVIKAEFGGQALYSVKPSSGDGVANVNQLTNAVVATLSSSGNPEKFASEVASGAASATESAVDGKVALLNAAIAPARDAVNALPGQDAGNFLNTSFSADGTGLDKVLDTVSLSLAAFETAAGATQSSLEVTFNTPTPLETAAEPTAVNFTSASTTQDIAALTASTVIALPVDGLPRLYRDFLNRMRACYALPLSQRVVNGVITAQACKNVFYNSDPTLYKDGGFTAEERFTAMVRSTAEIKIAKAVRPFVLQNITLNGGQLDGKALLAFVGSDDEGNLINASIVTRMFTLNGERVLGAFGDQNSAEFYVNSEIVATHHPLNGDTSKDYYSSGYSVYAPVYEPNGKTITKAILTTPKRVDVVMGKWTGRSSLRVCKTGEFDPNTELPNGNCTGTPTFIQGLIYAGQDPAAQTSSPHQDLNIRKYMVYSKTAVNGATCSYFQHDQNNPVTCPRTDEEIEGHRAGGLWKLKITYNDASVVTLWARHPVRAMSNRELVGPMGPEATAGKLTEATIERMKALNTAAVADGRAYSTWITGVNGIQAPIWAPAEGGYQFDWTVPEGGVMPRQVYLSGRVAYYDRFAQGWCRGVASNGCLADGIDRRPPFDEKLRFKSSKRTATLTCNLLDSDDVSCAGVTGTWVDANSALNNINQNNVTTSYAKGAWMSYANLWTKDTEQRNLIRAYNFFAP